MSQEQAIVLCLKIAIVAGFVSLVAWVAVYTRLAAWWRNSIGRTLVVETVLLAALFVPTGLSLFFTFNRLTSYVAGWVDVTLIGAVAPVMIWRTVVWVREARKGQKGVGDDA